MAERDSNGTGANGARPIVALASCAPYLAGQASGSVAPGAEAIAVVDDEGPLRDALDALGFDAVERAWDDPEVAWDRSAAVLLRTTWDYQERRDAFVGWAEAVARETLLLHGPVVVAWNTDKSYLRELAAAGAPLAPTVWLSAGSSVDLAAELSSRGWARALLKPRVGANARETLRFTADAAGLASAQAHAERVLAREDLLLQPYLAAVETEGECSLVFADGAFTHGVRKIPRPGDYKVQEDYGARDLPWLPDPAARSVAARVLELAEARLGERLLYARVDLLRDDAGAYVLNELELVEPALFLRHGPAAASRIAAGVAARVAVSPWVSPGSRPGGAVAP